MLPLMLKQPLTACRGGGILLPLAQAYVVTALSCHRLMLSEASGQREVAAILEVPRSVVSLLASLLADRSVPARVTALPLCAFAPVTLLDVEKVQAPDMKKLVASYFHAQVCWKACRASASRRPALPKCWHSGIFAIPIWPPLALDSLNSWCNGTLSA